MIAQTGEQVNGQGYVTGSLERMIRVWAIQYWPDAADEYNWRRFRNYYGAEWLKSMRRGLN